MEAGDWASWAAAAVAVIAMGIAIVQAKRANGEATRSADAATRSADAADRSADADQRMAELAEAQAAKYVPRWQVVHRIGDTYAVVNDSETSAYEVMLEIDEAAHPRKPDEPQDLARGEMIEFMASRTNRTGAARVTVRWRRTPGEGEFLTWSNPLPWRPR